MSNNEQHFKKRGERLTEFMDKQPIRCDTCGGTGHVAGHWCHTCEGTGIMRKQNFTNDPPEAHKISCAYRTSAGQKDCDCSRSVKAVFEGGATRSARDERRDLIPAAAISALGRRLAIGAKKHGENNWRKGKENFRKATIDHLLTHIFDYIENGNATDANTDAIICNAAFLCELEERTPLIGAKEMK